MRACDKVIVSCAVTGSVHTPSMSPALPLTPEDIATQAIGAAQAGAAILHLHARDPEDGRPTPSPDVFMRFLPKIRASTNAVVNITTGGSTGMSVAERLAAPLRAKPELCSMNMGSMNFVFSGAARRIETWKHPWERDYLLASEERIFANTFRQIEHTFRELGEGCGTRFEFECYDIGHLYTLAHFAERGLAKPPFFVQVIFGILGGMGAHPENFAHAVTIADKLFGDDYYLSAFAAGRHQMPFAAQSVVAGGSVRVGLEDSLHIGPGRLAADNAEQVAKVVRIIRELGRDIATPDEARRMLRLKGGDAVGF